jgi:hypothetical protein
MNFKKWLSIQEVGTGTNCVAGFQQRLGAVNRRWWISQWEEDLNKKQSRNRTKFTYTLPQVKD